MGSISIPAATPPEIRVGLVDVDARAAVTLGPRPEGLARTLESVSPMPKEEFVEAITGGASVFCVGEGIRVRMSERVVTGSEDAGVAAEAG